MKANLFAVVLSSSIVCLPGYSASNLLNNSSPPAMQKSAAKINLNKADSDVLIGVIKGVGQKRAEAIVKYRIDHGNFNSIEELAKVPGLGTRFVKNHLEQLQKIFIVN